MADDCEGRAGQNKHRWNPEAENTVCKDICLARVPDDSFGHIVYLCVGWLNKNGQWDNKTSGTIENGYNLTLLAVTDNMDQIENCTFYYTMDSTTPTKSSAHYASSASHGDSNIFINQSCTFKVFATSDNYKDSKVITWYFTIEGTDIRDTLTYEKTKSASHIHNISGQRLTKPTKGINIINDKKVVVK